MAKSLRSKRFADPTHTKVLRAAFSRDMRARVTRVQRLVKESIVERDSFGLQQVNFGFLDTDPAFPRFSGMPAQKQVAGFMAWLLMVEAREFGGIGAVRLVPETALPWQYPYLRQAYRKGLVRARAEMRKANIVPAATPLMPDASPANDVRRINLKEHDEALALTVQRAASETIGVWDATNIKIQRELTDGLTGNRDAALIAAAAVAAIDHVAQWRLRLVAETESVRGHHAAMMAEYRMAGVQQIGVLVEWVTAGDERVCQECESLSGQVFTIDEAQGLIPRHPQCRCVAIPVDVPEDRLRENVAAPEMFMVTGVRTNANHETEVLFSDGRSVSLGKLRGADGVDGRDGTAGEHGRDGNDGNHGINGAMGLRGLQGPQGAIGRDGKDGKPGKDGRAGDDGKPGPRGEQGTAGRKGQDGRDGAEGRQGEPGKNGKDGKHGKDGKDGITKVVKVVEDNRQLIYEHDSPGRRIRFRNPDGSWSEWIRLATGGGGGGTGAQGPKGDQGDPGPKGDKGDPGSGTGEIIFDGLQSDTQIWCTVYNLKDSTAVDFDILYDGGNA